MLLDILFGFSVLSIVFVTQAETVVTKNDPKLHNRRLNLLRREDINFQNFSQCARPYCNASASLSPSRLGCIEATLTKKCLCETAIAPLACVPSGPSSEDNCWYDTEDWLAGQCDGKIAVVPKASMPLCLQDCAVNWLRKKGCRTDTRNCFCKLDGNEVVGAVEICKKNGCMKHMQPDFQVPFWRDQVCAQGDINAYDEGAYRARKKRVHDIRIGVPVAVGFMVFMIIVSGFAAVSGGARCMCSAVTAVVVAVLLILCIIPPIFVAI